MASPEPREFHFNLNSYKTLKLSLFEYLLLVAMVVVLVLSSLDALEGQKIGKGDKLANAKRMGQQELMASTANTK